MDDNELLRTLAKKTGWEVIPGEGGVYAVVCKDRIYDYAYSEAEAWAKLKCSAPDWRHSVDAALALPWPKGYCFDIDMSAHGVMLRLFNVTRFPIKAQGATLARALCEVFAAWAGAQEAKEGER